MKIFNISNAQRFFEEVLACKGNVYVLTDGKNPHDLKNLAEYLISSGMTGLMRGIEQIEVSAEQLSDRERLLRFMSNMRPCNDGSISARQMRRGA